MVVRDRVAAIFDELIAIRRDFHRHPELSTREFRTGKKIVEYLKDWNIEYQTGYADTGIVALIRGGKGPGKVVALRADIDALPIQEPEGKEYGSVNPGVMHACGHDVHTAILLGAGKVLREMEKQIKGVVKLFFQPAEEAVGGAERMIRDGCLENPKVDYAVGLHVMPYLPSGRVELKYGKLNAYSDLVTIIIHGQSGHAAYPDKSVDAVAISGQVLTSLQMLVSRRTSPLDSVVLTFGMIRGGEKANIISDRVELSGTLRTLDDEARTSAKRNIEKIAAKVAEGFGGEAEVIFTDGYIALVNDDEVTNVVRKTALRVVGEDRVVNKEFPSMGGEDFSYFSDTVPASFYHIGCGNIEKHITAPLHSKSFDVDERCIMTGVEMQVETTLALLRK